MALAAIVLAAGKGVRMGSPLPKVVHPVAGRPMLAYVLDAVSGLSPTQTVLVVGVGRERVEAAARGHDVTIAVQDAPRGTGDAARAGLAQLGEAEEVLVMPGDTPRITTAVLADLVAARREGEFEVAMLTFEPPDAGSYGRVLRDASGGVRAVVEARDATPEALAVKEVNAGVYVFSRAALEDVLPRLRDDNAQGEIYLTDALGLLSRVAGVKAADPGIAVGINTPAQLEETTRRIETLQAGEGATIRGGPDGGQAT